MTYEEAAALLKEHGQLQLLEYYGELDEREREILLGDIAEIDFGTLKDIKIPSAAGKNAERKALNLSPADALALGEIERDGEKYKKVGLEEIKKGKVAAVLLAGGQGTRLGWNGPKGTFNIGESKKLSIFGCQMQNLLSVAEEAGAYPRLFIMTSELNDGQTRGFFKENSYFGYPQDRICFYKQKTAPALSFDGKILLAEKHRVALTPNGNGGWFSSLKEADCGRFLKSEGIEWLNVYGVDNVLQRICDPTFIGATVLSGKACSGKVVRKVSPDEKVGVLCKDGGLPAIVEYYEMPEEYKNLRGGDGELVYTFGVILNYLFCVKKLNEICNSPLPYHLAEKKIDCIADGVKVAADKPNGYKLETLAVDIVKLMGSCLGYEVKREKEFAPVKNKTGVDSVDTARALLKANGVQI